MNPNDTFRNKIVPTAHVAVIMVGYASPLFVPWPFVLIAFVLYRLQFVFLKSCVLSKMQFGDNEEFYYHYLKKIYPKINKKILNFVTDNVIPLLVVILAIIIQVK